jgi:predicted MFS family arabinose efflux permease
LYARSICCAARCKTSSGGWEVVTSRASTSERECVVIKGERSAWDYWLRFAVVYACGVLAASSISKVAPVAVELRGELDLSLDQVALVASSVTLVAALLGLPAGYLVERTVPARPLVVGCCVMAVSGLVGSGTGAFTPLMATRVAESIGYVAVVVAAPVLLIAMDDGPRRTTALAMWGTFVPVGLALGSFAGGALSGLSGWRSWFALDAAALLIVGLAAAALLRSAAGSVPHGADEPAARVDWAHLRGLIRPVLLALGFATVSGTIVAVVTLLPTYLHESLPVSIAAAGTLTGAVSLVGVTGGVLAARLLRCGVPACRLFLTALLMPVGTAVAFLGIGGLGPRVLGAALVAVANELVVATVFASIPTVVTRVADIALANGLVAQLGSAGSLLGPPLISLAVLAADGWWAVAPVVLGACTTGALMLRFAVGRPVM